MNLKNSKYIILELIPTAFTKEKGEIVQLSALKVEGIKLLDRFDYRLKEEKVPIPEFIEMCSYDKESFTYLDSTEDILDAFQKWIEDLPLLMIDDTYTNNYLENISNTRELIWDYLNLSNRENVIQEMITKYQLEESNYLVDLVYEAIIREI